MGGTAMYECSFCGSTEGKHAPLCQSCGALRYPIVTSGSSQAISSRQEKLKYSAIAAATIFIPGSLLMFAFVGIRRFSFIKKT